MAFCWFLLKMVRFPFGLYIRHVCSRLSHNVYPYTDVIPRYIRTIGISLTWTVRLKLQYRGTFSILLRAIIAMILLIHIPALLTEFELERNLTKSVTLIFLFHSVAWTGCRGACPIMGCRNNKEYYDHLNCLCIFIILSLITNTLRKLYDVKPRKSLWHLTILYIYSKLMMDY